MKQLPAGQLRNRVTFQKQVISEDGYNVINWKDDFSKWASIETGTSNETELSGRVLGEIFIQDKEGKTYNVNETLIEPILFKGSLTILDCSANACSID